MLPQPIATIVNGDRTDPVYSRGSRKLAIGDKMDNRPHDSVDNRHVNESSGVLWLRDFFDIVAPEADRGGSMVAVARRWRWF